VTKGYQQADKSIHNGILAILGKSTTTIQKIWGQISSDQKYVNKSAS